MDASVTDTSGDWDESVTQQMPTSVATTLAVSRVSAAASSSVDKDKDPSGIYSKCGYPKCGCGYLSSTWYTGARCSLTLLIVVQFQGTTKHQALGL